MTSFFCNPFPFSWNAWAGHRVQNHLLNPDIGERGRKLSGYPRHNQEPLHEEATELLDTQLGRSWSDRWSFPRSVFVARSHHHLPTGPHWRCTLPPFQECILRLGSIVFVCVFADFHRFRTLLRRHEPFSIIHKITIKKLKIFIPACWIISAIPSIPQFFVWEFEDKELVCRPNSKTPILKVLHTGYFFFTVVCPTAILLALYSRLIRRLWFQKNTNSVMLQAVRRSRKKITKTMLILSGVFAICWYPDAVRHFLEIYFPSHVSFSPTSSNVFHGFVLLNSTINPFIYAFQFANFRRELVKMCCCGWRRYGRIHASPRTREEGRVEGKGRVHIEMRNTDGIV